jgi:hypothetical protein
MKNNLVFALLLILAFSERVFFDLGPNFEFVTAALLLSSAYLGRQYAVSLVLFVMIASDLVIGNTNIFLFTWSGFLIPALIAPKVLNRAKNKIISGSSTGIATSLFFYVWTNLGVWALDSWGMYTNDINGLMMAYINGLPFLRMNLISTILLVPTGFVLFETYLLIKKAKSYKLAIS